MVRSRVGVGAGWKVGGRRGRALNYCFKEAPQGREEKKTANNRSLVEGSMSRKRIGLQRLGGF